MKIITVLCLLFILAGCNERFADPREMLIKSPADWIIKYGDDFESQQTANIALAISVINRQAEAIKELDRRLIEMEKITDPNEVDWSFEYDYRLGRRSDGIVVWKPFETK